jgi:hypothetical protein
MRDLRYAAPSIYGDYARAGFGLLVTLPPLLLLEPAPFFTWLLAGLTLLFGLFALRTALRQVRRVDVTAEAIVLAGPLGRRLAWDDLERVRLAYYAPRRNREGGWLQLTLRGRGGPIRIDSNLEGFDQVAHRAAAVAADKGVELDPVTSANFQAMGIHTPNATPAEATL